MKGDAKVIDYLNAALRSELTAVSQYWLHYRLQEDWGVGHLADKSRAEDIDMVKGIADFQNQQTGYQAALQSYAQVQKLSLFNYLG